MGIPILALGMLDVLDRLLLVALGLALIVKGVKGMKR